MRSGIKALLIAVLIVVGAPSSASALSRVRPFHEWTFEVGGRTFGFTEYVRSHHTPLSTTIHYGFGSYRVDLPARRAVALSITLPLLVALGGLLIVRRRRIRAAA